MEYQIEQRMYDFYGRFYDWIPWMFRSQVGRVIETLGLRAGERVLDVGIGTGLSLSFFPDNVAVVGVDLSAGMLRQAARKLAQGLVRAEAQAPTDLMQADALALPFGPGEFDCVFMSHVIATVPDPGRALGEALRVCRENGRIVLVNHFQSPWTWLGWVEKTLDPLCRQLGWRADLPLEELLAPLGVERIRRTPGWMFQRVYLRKMDADVRMLDAEQVERVAGIAAWSGIRGGEERKPKPTGDGGVLPVGGGVYNGGDE